jgi:hypothetical protein
MNRGIEFIADQGMRFGESELKGRSIALECARFRGFCQFACIVRKYARLAWVQKVEENAEYRRHLHIVAKGKGNQNV